MAIGVVVDLIDQLLELADRKDWARGDDVMTREEFDGVMAELFSEWLKRTDTTYAEAGRRMGVTFQQTQKYKNGDNSIPLYRFYRLLNSYPESKGKGRPRTDIKIVASRTSK